jgi:hypothetical protein
MQNQKIFNSLVIDITILVNPDVKASLHVGALKAAVE